MYSLRRTLTVTERRMPDMCTSGALLVGHLPMPFMALAVAHLSPMPPDMAHYSLTDVPRSIALAETELDIASSQ